MQQPINAPQTIPEQASSDFTSEKSSSDSIENPPNSLQNQTQLLPTEPNNLEERSNHLANRSSIRSIGRIEEILSFTDRTHLDPTVQQLNNAPQTIPERAPSEHLAN